MKTRQEPSWRRPRRGTTLVEALAGTLILGTLLVSILTAKVQLEGQGRRATARITACEVLDGLLNQWWTDPASLPRADQGDVPNYEGWRWRTRTVQSRSASAVGAEIVAVEVFGPPPASAELAAASVELLMAKATDANQ